MFRRWFVGLNQRNWSNKRLSNADQPGPERPNHLLHKFDAVHEVAIYIHRFHNLDLFQQGWYRIKVTMRWEDGEDSFPGIPARVVQYEAPEMSADNFRVWMIDDTDNSFSTPPFRIRYARQDVLLSIMISFYLLPQDIYEGKSSAVILKFELMHFPTYEVGLESQGSPTAYATSFHEYRIPPKALMGLHSYCPVHFDSFHAVLIDTSVHISLLKSGYHTHRLKVPSKSSTASEGTCDNDGSNKVALFKALLAAHDILLEDLRRLSKGINQALDLSEITFKSDVTNSFTSSSPVDLKSIDGEVNFQLLDQPQVNVENSAHDSIDLSAASFHSCSWEDMSNSFQSLGNQLSNIWNTFLQFHREHKTKILEFLRTSWANDRRTEWSIWMVYTKVELPHHQYANDGSEGTSLYQAAVRGRSSSTRRLIDYPIQTAIMRAELHRRGVAQMRINHRSLQDMYIFGDPLRIPVIIVERLANINRSATVKSYIIPVEQKAGCVLEHESKTIDKLSKRSRPQHFLRVVVFVHGFQGHHLDLRIVRNQWLLIDPKAQFLMSKANEDRTSEDFRDMGSRLAKEVISFLKRRIDKASRMGNLKDIKLSFVGHSIGNLIIRSALADSIMEPYLRYLFTYVSVSGPHLGYMYSSNSIFNSGLWLLKKIKDIQCIHQLTFTDDHELENTFIYNLSKKRTLANFRNVILLSSPQDGYVPYHSARIELCPAASLDLSKQGKVFLEMLNNCMDQIRPDSEDRVVMRCDVNFETSSQGRNFNTLIGRAAHIEFLECDIFVKFIMWSFPELFM